MLHQRPVCVLLSTQADALRGVREECAAFSCVCAVQIPYLCDTLTAMQDRVHGGAHEAEGELALAGHLLPHHIRGEDTPDGWSEADVQYASAASIRRGAHVVRTAKATEAQRREHFDHYVYVPYMGGRSGNTPNACVMKVKQIVRIRQAGLGWPDDEAKLAVGIMYDHLPCRHGAGLETRYQDNPQRGATSVPRCMFASDAKLENGYRWAIHLRAIHCTTSHNVEEWDAGTAGSDRAHSGLSFWTCSKMGFHGNTELTAFRRMQHRRG